jgi:hypothetical protein
VVPAPADVPVDVVPVEVVPLEIVPVEAVPVDVFPVDTVPLDVVPLEVVPLDVLPELVLPAKDVPELVVPVDVVPHAALACTCSWPKKQCTAHTKYTCCADGIENVTLPRFVGANVNPLYTPLGGVRLPSHPDGSLAKYTGCTLLVLMTNVYDRPAVIKIVGLLPRLPRTSLVTA